MNLILIILVLLAVICMSVSIRLLFETIFRENSIRDRIESFITNFSKKLFQ